METIEIRKENVMAAYNEARKNGYAPLVNTLETLFGKDVFKPKDVTERIKTFEDACEELGEEHPFIVAYCHMAKIEECDNFISYIKLCIICAALNEEWEPKFTEDETRWYPWHWLYTQDGLDDMDENERADRHLMLTGDYLTEYAGFAYANSTNAPSYTNTNFGSRLCFKSERLATYCGKQFIELWADFKLIRK